MIDETTNLKPEEPTPEEIRRRCAEIQASWSEREFRLRNTTPRKRVTITRGKVWQQPQQSDDSD